MWRPDGGLWANAADPRRLGQARSPIDAYDAVVGIDWVDLARGTGLARDHGRLGMTGLRGAARLSRADGVDTVVLLVEDHELQVAALESIVTDLAGQGIVVVRWPIEDMGVPADRMAFQSLVDTVRDELLGGRTVIVACQAGLGRTGTIVACLLVAGGLQPDEAIALARGTRPGAIERQSQVEFVRDWSTASH
jgi:protein-tyrosine phosphatase